MFVRPLDAGKLYTERYVKRLKAANTKLMDKFTMGSKYALTAQKKQIMERASRLVVESNNKLLETFQNEAMIILHQNRTYEAELIKKTKQCDDLIKVNRDLEQDMFCILRQNDYVEERIPKFQKEGFQAYHRQPVEPSAVATATMNLLEAEDLALTYPKVPGEPRRGQFKWESLSVDERIERATFRSHIDVRIDEMEPKLMN